MELKFNIKRFRFFLFTLFVTAVFQLTDVTFFSIKIGELLILMIIPYLVLRIKKLNIFIFLFFCFFLSATAITIALNPGRTFFIPLEVNSLLKRPYLITISRFIELVCCLGFVCFAYTFLLDVYNKYKIHPFYFVGKILFLNLQFQFCL